MNEFDTPVAFFIFNRLKTTQLVFEAIRKARPKTLLLIADGPRPNKSGEARQCQLVQDVVEQVDWNCRVLKNYSDQNLGCKNRISSGLDWVFSQVEEAIILEDDCLPHPTFFRFCTELLDYYRHDERVMVISGNNFQFGHNLTEYSYYFSCYNHCWGWATWRRAWQYYDVEMKLWPIISHQNWLQDFLQGNAATQYWNTMFQAAYNNEINTWDYQWTFSCWTQRGLTILPNCNLISNIGFGTEATHTRHTSSIANLPVEPMSFPIQHPPFMVRDYQADSFTQKHLFRLNFISLLKSRIWKAKWL